MAARPSHQTQQHSSSSGPSGLGVSSLKVAHAYSSRQCSKVCILAVALSLHTQVTTLYCLASYMQQCVYNGLVAVSLSGMASRSMILTLYLSPLHLLSQTICPGELLALYSSFNIAPCEL